jgi:hypothetical protein
MLPKGDHQILKNNLTTVECPRFAMNFPASVLIKGRDSLPTLEPTLTAQSFNPITASEFADLLAKTLSTAGDGNYISFRLPGGCCSR